MPHRWSPLVAERRAERARRRGYVVATPPGHVHILAQARVAGAARSAIAALEAHVAIDSLNDSPHHFLRDAALAARDKLGPAALRSALAVNKSAGHSKHTVSFRGSEEFPSPVALPSRTPCVKKVSREHVALADGRKVTFGPEVVHEYSVGGDVEEIEDDADVATASLATLANLGGGLARLQTSQLDVLNRVRALEQKDLSGRSDVDQVATLDDVRTSQVEVLGACERAVGQFAKQMAAELVQLAAHCESRCNAILQKVQRDHARHTDLPGDEDACESCPVPPPPAARNVLRSFADEQEEMELALDGDPFEMMRGMCCAEDRLSSGPFVLLPHWACFSLRGMLERIRSVRVARLAAARVQRYGADYSRFDGIASDCSSDVGSGVLDDDASDGWAHLDGLDPFASDAGEVLLTGLERLCEAGGHPVGAATLADSPLSRV